MVSLARLSIAIVVLGALWLLALGQVLAAVRRKRTLITDFPTRKRRLAVWLAAGYLLATTLAVPYSIYIEPYWPEVTRVAIDSGKLRGNASIRIVHLSDLHSDPQARLEDEVPKIVADLAPDLVVLTGDGVNSKEGIPVFRRCVKELAAHHPTYAVKGNWESWWFKGIDVFEGTGVVELDGNAVSQRVGADRIWIAGVAVENEDRIENSLKSVPRGELTIFLHHYPALAGKLSNLGVDVHLAGDTHGGQIRLPLLGELARIRRHGVWESAGLHRKGNLWLYVNRGIGMEGRSAPRVRFGCRPEITVIELSREKTKGS